LIILILILLNPAKNDFCRLLAADVFLAL